MRQASGLRDGFRAAATVPEQEGLAALHPSYE
jgi:hypothetical protein